MSLLQSGKATPAQLAKMTGLNRTTVYSLCKSLIKRGLVIEDPTVRPRKLTPAPPGDLRRLLLPTKDEVERKEKMVSDLIHELSGISAKASYSMPRIRFIESPRFRDFLYDEHEKWYLSAGHFDGIMWGFQDNEFVEEYRDWIDYIWEKHPDRQVRLLTNDSREEAKIRGKYPPGRQVKFWRLSQNFTASLWIAGEYIILLYTRDKNDYLVEIKDAVLSHNLREVFQGLWSEVSNSY